jgi:hypothetical protein
MIDIANVTAMNKRPNGRDFDLPATMTFLLSPFTRAA